MFITVLGNQFRQISKRLRCAVEMIASNCDKSISSCINFEVAVTIAGEVAMEFDVGANANDTQPGSTGCDFRITAGLFYKFLGPRGEIAGLRVSAFIQIECDQVEVVNAVGGG